MGDTVPMVFTGISGPAMCCVTAQSDPQRREPPRVVVGAMKWPPRPSIRTAVVLFAAAGAGLWATGRRRGFA